MGKLSPAEGQREARGVQAWLPIIVVALITVVYAGISCWIGAAQAPNQLSDISAHLESVTDIWLNPANGGLPAFYAGTTYPGWHGVVALLIVMGVPSALAAGLASGFYAALACIMAFVVSRMVIGEEQRWLSVASMVVIVFVTAIYVPWYNPEIYMGQGSPTVWHNPTYAAVKPFALMSCAVLYVMIRDRRADLSRCIAYGALTLVCLVMKPSFFQVQAPAVFLYLLIDLILNRDVRFVRNIALSFIPGILYMLIPLWTMLFSSSGGGEGVAVGLFVVYGLTSPNRLISILLLLAFPLYATIVLRRDIFTKSSPYLFLLIMLVVGFLEYSLLYEPGERLTHGNFSWGYYLSIFLYWAFMLPLFVKRAFVDKSLARWVVVLGCILVLAHFASGLLYCKRLTLGALGNALM